MTLLLTAVVAVSMVASVVALPFLGGGGLFDQHPDDAADGPIEIDGPTANTDADTGDERLDESESVATGTSDLETVSMAAVEPELETADAGALTQDDEDAVEAGVEEGLELAQAQGVEITQEQQTAALEGASQSAAQYQEAQAEQIQEATKGAVHGSLMQSQAVEAEQVQAAVGRSTSGIASAGGVHHPVPHAAGGPAVANRLQRVGCAGHRAGYLHRQCVVCLASGQGGAGAGTSGDAFYPGAGHGSEGRRAGPRSRPVPAADIALRLGTGRRG